MTCAEARDNWMLYLDSEGDAALHLQVGEHLGRCPDCAGWFARRRRLEDEVNARLAAGEASPAVWGRVLAGAGLAPRRRRPRLLLAGAVAAVAACAALVWLTWPAPELGREAARLHRGWLAGEVRPDFASTSELAVDRYFKAHAPFRVHCPPRSDVRFAVEGAGLHPLADGHPAGYIVGRVEGAPVSILVLDRRRLARFPRDEGRLAAGRRRSSDGGFQMVAALLADNVVVVTGRAPPETLDRLLDAYGSYH
jgi:anti-sigma factor RsiW